MSPMHARWSRLYRGTKAELAIEDAVAALGVPYRNNFPCFIFGSGRTKARYFPDFLLPTLGIVLEIDDRSHRHKVEADAERSRVLLEEFGWRVARCTNDEALENPRAAVQKMLRDVGMWPLPESRRSLADSLPRTRHPAPKWKSR